MPAIQLNRLNAEVQYLANQYNDPVRFTSGLIDLFERYAAWSFRSGEATRRNIQIPQYHLPPIVINKLILAIRPHVLQDPERSLELAEELWRGKYLEIRQLAVSILSLLPIEDPKVFLKTLERWLEAASEAYLVLDLLERGCGRMRTEYTEDWLYQIETWLESAKIDDQVTGLRALLVSVREPQFKHLPNVYRLITSLLIASPQHSIILLQDILDELIRRSPAETSFFFQQILLRKPARDTARIVRRKLSSLPKESQNTLRILLKDLNTLEENEPSNS